MPTVSGAMCRIRGIVWDMSGTRNTDRRTERTVGNVTFGKRGLPLNGQLVNIFNTLERGVCCSQKLLHTWNYESPGSDLIALMG